MPSKLIKTSWNGGLLSQWMDGREDINKYYSGASILINAFVLPHGGFEKRPGTKYIATAPGKCRLTPFEFSVDDTLVLEWSESLLRFYKDGTQVFRKFGTEDLSDFDSATGDSSLVAHWTLNDNLATTNVVDATVAGSHDGTATVNTSTISTADESGATNKALDFSSGTDYITVGDDNDFSFGDGSDDSPFSIISWANYISNGSTQMLVSKFDSGAVEWELSMVGSTDTLRFDIYDNSEGARIIQSNDTIADGWHFFVATYDGRGGGSAEGGMKLYIDGAEVTTTSFPSLVYVAMENTVTDVGIGTLHQTGSPGSSNWEGDLNNAAIFDKELSANEIANLSGTTGTDPYSIVSPYTIEQAFDIHYTQSADVVYIAHKNVHPKKLSRIGDINWTIIDVPFIGGPFLEENFTDTRLLGFARTGGAVRSEFYFLEGTIGTLTATAHSPFDPNHVGSLWLLKHTRDGDNSTNVFAQNTNIVPTSETLASGAIFIKGGYTVTFEPIATGKSARLWRKQGNGKWQEFRSFRGPTAFSATELEDDVLYAMTRSDVAIKGNLTAKNQINYGVVEITAVTNSGLATCEVKTKVYSNNTNDNAVTTPMWAEGAWSDFRGYPRTVTFFEDRLWWAGSTNNPDTLWGSKSSDYENMSFTDEGLDDEAITFPINDNEVSNLQWMIPRQVMAVGAANREYRFGANDRDKAATPNDRKAIPQTSFGSDNIQPVILDDAIFFFQRAGKKLGAMKFDSISENFDVTDATLLAYKLFDSVPTTLSVQRVPDSLLWATRTDGVLPTYSYEPKEEISAWATQLTDNSANVETPLGLFLSTAIIHGSSEDEVWVSVRREIDSSTVYYVEKFADRDFGSDISDAFFVDAGITDTGGATTVSNLDHLEGKEVVVLLDGIVLAEGAGDYTVQQGSITLPSAGTTAQAGLPYIMKARSMRLAIPQEGNTIQSKIKRISETVIRFIKSLGGKAGVEFGGIEYIQDIGATFSSKSQDTPQNFRPAPGGLSEEAYTTITHSDPAPFTCLASIVTAEIEEKR